MTTKRLGLAGIIPQETSFDFEAGLGDYTIEQLRRICQEAIARGEAHERAQRRRLKLILQVTTIAAAGSTAVVAFFSFVIH